MGSGSFPSGHVAKPEADLGQVVRRENNFNGLIIPKQENFGLLVEWTQKMGCTQDHQFIVDCL